MPLPTLRPMHLEEDLDQVLALYTVVFGTEETGAKWRWKYLPPWADRPLAWVAVEGDRIVGHVGAVPVRGVLDGVPTWFAQVVDAMLHPDARGGAGFAAAGFSLFEEVEARCPGAVLYGFTGRRPFLWYRRQRFSDLVEDACDILVRAGCPAAPLRPDIRLEAWDWTDPALDALWERQGHPVRTGLIRDGAYLRWRYGDHPTDRFRLVGVMEDGEPAGWAVLEDAPTGGEARVNDVLLPPPLIRPALDQMAAELGAETLVLWLPASYRLAFAETRDVGMCVHHVVWKSRVSTDALRRSLYYTLGDVDGW